MPMPPTCTAKRSSSSLSFGSQTGRVRELAGLLVANVAGPAFGAVCIPVQCFGETRVGPNFPDTLRWSRLECDRLDDIAPSGVSPMQTLVLFNNG